MKFILRIVAIVICIGAALALLMILINPTFMKEVYKTDDMDAEGIVIPKYMYKLNSDVATKADFVTFLSKGELEQKQKEYLDKTEFCYGKYYYDQENNITMLNYSIQDLGKYRKVHMEYDIKNFCSDRYKISENWIQDYEQSTLEKTDITITNIVLLMLNLKNSVREDNPIIPDNYKSDTSIKLECQLKGSHYTLVFKDFNEDEIVVVKTQNNETEFAVYRQENAKEYLKSLM